MMVNRMVTKHMCLFTFKITLWTAVSKKYGQIRHIPGIEKKNSVSGFWLSASIAETTSLSLSLKLVTNDDIGRVRSPIGLITLPEDVG